MHFSIPDVQEFTNELSGSSFTGYNIHINGSFHCCLRYKQLHSLHEQLKRSLPTLVLPSFPPKKILPLTPNQTEQRRLALERYIQLIGKDPVFSKSDLLRTFLLKAQQESSFTDNRETTLDVYLMNGYRISVNVYTTECSTKVLEKACQFLDLNKDYVYYFSLFLMRKENDGGITLVRRLMDFESPFISLKNMNDDCKLVIRKGYWDSCYDVELMCDKIATNLLYIQTLSDVERDWIVASMDIKEQLSSLQSRGHKKQYLEIARSLPCYGCVQFSHAIVDYPLPNSPALVIIGNKELSLRTLSDKKIQETKFKVTRMRCWRVTTIHSSEENSSNSSNDINSSSSSTSSTDANVCSMEMSFEYLMPKNCLQWITIYSESAMLMSVCLQSIVDELLNQKGGYDMNNIQTTNAVYSQMAYIRRDGSFGRITDSSPVDMISNYNEAEIPLNTVKRGNVTPAAMKKKAKEKFSGTVRYSHGRDSVHNEAFEGIGDDDL